MAQPDFPPFEIGPMVIDLGGPWGGAGFVPGGSGPPPPPPSPGVVPPFLSGMAPGFAGAPGAGGFAPRRRLAGLRASPPAQEGPGGGGGGGGGWPWPGWPPIGVMPQLPLGMGPAIRPQPAPVPPAPVSPSNPPDSLPLQDYPWGSVRSILNTATGSGMFGMEPPASIMAAIREQAIADAGAQERAARLGLQARGDIDPSTYGYQALQSQLLGQQNVSNALSQGSLALRQQQQQYLWDLLGRALSESAGIRRAEIGRPLPYPTQQQPAPQKSGTNWGSILGGVGKALALISKI